MTTSVLFLSLSNSSIRKSFPLPTLMDGRLGQFSPGRDVTTELMGGQRRAAGQGGRRRLTSRPPAARATVTADAAALITVWPQTPPPPAAGGGQTGRQVSYGPIWA